MAIIRTVETDIPHGAAGYRGIIGTCAGCRQPRQRLTDGQCLSCRQAAERQRGRKVPAPPTRACALCHAAIIDPAQNQRYHQDCAEEMRRLAGAKAGRDRTQRRKK